MPIYEYQCNKCSKKFEVLVYGSREKSLACPKCKSRGLKKLFSSFSFSGTRSSGESASGKCTNCTSGACSTCH